MTLRIYSYNVNGNRAAMSKGLVEFLEQDQPDIVCFQETKASPEQIETTLFESLGYHHYWYSAEKKGYSGVGILCKNKPDRVVYGMNKEEYDREGRFLRADFGSVSVISVYHPSGTSGEDRQAFKMQWLEYFQQYINDLRKERPHLIISGDYNIAHTKIDIHDPVGNAGNSGFLPEERQWVSDFLKEGYVDSFRAIHPDTRNLYSWWSYRFNARSKNKGWRIDYHMTTESLRDKIKDADILTHIVHSDHCPISITLDI
ncbi:MAG: exodeoxyribonuclease III [Bacteroidales bacterium]|nr:exodeoxyribonuclease III [Bacteroidales bacterium]